MALLLKIASAVSLAVAALWTTVDTPVTSAPAPAAAPSEALLWPGATTWAYDVLDTLSLAEKAGQLVVARAEAPTADLLADVRAGRVGGLDVRPAAPEPHLTAVRTWQEAAPLPLLLWESGDGPSAFAPAAPLAMGAAARPDLVYLAGKAAAGTATTLGVHSPASALFVAPGATPFGDPGAARTALGAALVRGLRDGGVMPAATARGPVGGPTLRPLMDAGLMVVRVRVPAEGPLDEAERTIRSVRDDAAFNGLVIADLAGYRTQASLARLVAAGADLVVTDEPAATARSLAEAVRDGQVPRGRLDASVRRALAAKAWNGLDALAPPRRSDGDRAEGGPVVRLSPWRPPSASLERRTGLLARHLARQAITVLQDEAGPVPFVGPRPPGAVLTVLLDPSADPDALLPFANAVSTGFDDRTQATYARLPLGAPDTRYRDALAAADEADAVVVGVLPERGGELAARHRAFVEAVLAQPRPVVLVLFGAPSAASGLPRPASLVVAYDASAAAQAAAAEALHGTIAVGGQLPVSVAGLAQAGDGVRLRQQVLRPGTAEEAGLAPDALSSIHRVVDEAVRAGAFPGAALAVGRAGVLVEMRGTGRLTPGGARVTADTPYDLASVTKVVGTTAAVMTLVEAGALDLDAPVARYVPDYHSLGKDRVTVRHLLEHSAGHRPFYPFYAHGILDREAVLRFVYADTLQYTPGTRSVYSDFDMILLGEVIEAVSGDALDEVFERDLFAPLGMSATGFRRPGTVDPDAAPTERDDVWRGRTLQGEVHDEAASVMGGVAGHAGLFSTARDLARFGFLLANGGEAYGTRLFRRTTLDRFTRPIRLRGTYPMGLGWMLQSTDRGYSAAGSLFGPRSFGHTGFTGTSIWIDPDQELFVVLLSNRVHPTRRNRRIREVRAALADAVAGAIETPPHEAALGWGFGPVPTDLLAAR